MEYSSWTNIPWNELVPCPRHYRRGASKGRKTVTLSRNYSLFSIRYFQFYKYRFDIGYVHVVLPKNSLLTISQLMTGIAHEDGREKSDGYWSFPRPAPMIWGWPLWSLRRGASGGIKSG